jgi:tryptophan synthase alpha chain
MSNRIKTSFSKLAKENKPAFVSFVTGADPDLETSLEIIKGLPKNGTDLIEVGIPFLDPAGDGPTIELAGKRAIKNGATLKKILAMISDFRKSNQETPLILMGYYNSILHYGLEKFIIDAKNNGVDGVLIVDLPIEEDDEFYSYCQKHDFDSIKLITPTSSEERMKKIIKKASGFIYFVSIAGITGTKASDPQENRRFIKTIKDLTDTPVVIGFGIKNKQQADAMSQAGADGIVVGSRLVSVIEEGLEKSHSKQDIQKELLQINKGFTS